MCWSAIRSALRSALCLYLWVLQALPCLGTARMHTSHVQVAMYVASERQPLVRGMCLLNCVGGMNQRGLYGDSLQLLLMRPVFELLEALLKRKTMASWLFSKFRHAAPWRLSMMASTAVSGVLRHMSVTGLVGRFL